MKRLVTFTYLVLTGCATTTVDGTRANVNCDNKEHSLTRAVALYERGNEKDATACLQEIIAKGKNSGVTDEALFRLSLINLRKAVDREDVEQSQRRLETLQRDYPSSSWTQMAVPLIAFLRESQRQSRELKAVNNNLRGHNLSLSKENRELRQTIEKLKYLDLELEKKPRRP